MLFAIGGVVACIVQLGLQTGWATPYGLRNSWRTLVGLEAVPSLVMLGGALRCLESPRWLLQTGQDAEAERVLHRIYAPRKLPPGSLRDGVPCACQCDELNAEMADAARTLAADTRTLRSPVARCVHAAEEPPPCPLLWRALTAQPALRCGTRPLSQVAGIRQQLEAAGSSRSGVPERDRQLRQVSSLPAPDQIRIFGVLTSGWCTPPGGLPDVLP